MAKEPFAARLTSIWIGALFFGLLSGFNGGYRKYFDPKYEQRNLWVGYLITLIALILVIYFFFIGNDASISDKKLN